MNEIPKKKKKREQVGLLMALQKWAPGKLNNKISMNIGKPLIKKDWTFHSLLYQPYSQACDFVDILPLVL